MLTTEQKGTSFPKSERKRERGDRKGGREKEGGREMGIAYLWKNLCKLPREKMSSYDAK